MRCGTSALYKFNSFFFFFLRFTLQVVQIDKVFGEIQEFTQLLPRPYAHAAPIICVSLLIAHMRLNALGGYETIIIDWPTRRYILLDGFRGSSVFPTPVAVRRVNTDIPRRSLGSTSFPDDTSSSSATWNTKLDPPTEDRLVCAASKQKSCSIPSPRSRPTGAPFQI
jgi:hypothetical protein